MERVATRLVCDGVAVKELNLDYFESDLRLLCSAERASVERAIPARRREFFPGEFSPEGL